MCNTFVVTVLHEVMYHRVSLTVDACREDTVSKDRKKKAKQRKRQKEDSQERDTDSGKEKKSTR